MCGWLFLLKPNVSVENVGGTFKILETGWGGKDAGPAQPVRSIVSLEAG